MTVFRSCPRLSVEMDAEFHNKPYATARPKRQEDDPLSNFHCPILTLFRSGSSFSNKPDTYRHGRSLAGIGSSELLRCRIEI